MLGKVYLIGAGPGDEGLLTVKADKIIRKAEVFVYDRLVSSSIMRTLPKNAELIDVGKNVGNHPVPQDEINQILLKKALEGKLVVRLKGGDSFVFGRGGEELELLSEHNIPFEVIPGITSAIAAAAYAGIPITHRDFCSSVHIITGHARAGCKLSLDYDALVRLNGTLVFLMSVSTVSEISQGLIYAGMDKDMPTCIIENGTRPNQRKVLSTLENIGEKIITEKVKSPAVIVVGKVCSLSERLDWFGKMPLKGKQVLITRPVSKIGKLSTELSSLGAEVIDYPCIETEFNEFSVPTQGYDWFIFTSSVGVDAYFSALHKDKKDTRALSGIKMAVVGVETAKTLLSYGIVADFIPTIYDGVHLAQELLSTGTINSYEKALLIRGEIASPELPQILSTNKIDITEINAYCTNYIKNTEINIDNIDYACFTSASTVEGFVNCFTTTDFSKVNAICIGTQTEKSALSYGMKTICANTATIESMVEKILEVSNEH